MAMQRRLAAADINLRLVLDLVGAGTPTEQLFCPHMLMSNDQLVRISSHLRKRPDPSNFIFNVNVFLHNEVTEVTHVVELHTCASCGAS